MLQNLRPTMIERLRAIEEDFRYEARIGDVRHDLISPDGRVPPNPAGWAAFQRANSPLGLFIPQTWEVYPDCTSCCRYEGDPTRLRRFRQLAGEAFDLLSLLRLVEPSIRLPKAAGHLGWIEVVYRTAMFHATASLRAVHGWWNWSGGLTLEEGDRWATDPDGATYPLHPAHDRLTSGLFHSSAEAIRCWFDPDHAERVADPTDDPPVDFARPEVRPAEFTRRPPFWDGNSLRCDGVAVATFTDAAESCRGILNAFQESGWPEAVDDPLPGRADKNPQRRLGYAVEVLNAKQTVVHFYRNGTGEQVCWCWGDSRPARFRRVEGKCRR